ANPRIDIARNLIPTLQIGEGVTIGCFHGLRVGDLRILRSRRVANARYLEGARVPRAGEAVSDSRTFPKDFLPRGPRDFKQKFVSAERRNQHARRARSPIRVPAKLSICALADRFG